MLRASGKNMPEDIRKRVGEHLKARIKVLSDLMGEERMDALEFAKECGVLESSLCVEIGTTWDCEKSPFGLCAYNNMDDTAHDNCLFCGGPEERK